MKEILYKMKSMNIYKYTIKDEEKTINKYKEIVATDEDLDAPPYCTFILILHRLYFIAESQSQCRLSSLILVLCRIVCRVQDVNMIQK